VLTFIPDIAEEHYEELQFLWSQRRNALRSSAYTMREMGMLEERIEAHTQGLLVLGDHLLELVAPGLDGDDELPAFAAAHTLLRLGTPDAVGRVRDVFVRSDGKKLDGLREALAHGPAQSLMPLLQQLFTSAAPPLAAAAGEVLAFHRAFLPSAEQLVPLARDEHPTVRRTAWRLATYWALGMPAAVYETGLHDDDPAVQQAAFEAAAWSGYPGWVAYCQTLAAQPSPKGVEPIATLAAILPPQESQTVTRLAATPAFGPTRHRIAAAFGHPTMIDFLLQEMESTDPPTAAGAGAAFGKMLGVTVDSGRRATVPPPDGEAPDEFEVEFLDEVNLPDVPRARQHWEKARPQLVHAVRIAHGLDVSAGMTRETFGLLNMQSRRELCLRARLTLGWTGTPLVLDQFPLRA
jgi:uncharacterized protein (TIGR02270 family)